MTPASRRRGSVGVMVARLLLVLGSIALTLAAAELATRWARPALPTLLLPDRSSCQQRSGTLSIAPLPSCTGVLSDTPVQTNAYGLRSPEVRDDGSARILALGDSCTWGWRVAQDEAYPSQLQAIFDRRADGPRVQVLNAGVAGYTSHQGLVYLRERGLALQPAIVIIGFGWNDMRLLGDVVEQIEAENRRMTLIRLDDWLLLHSHFYRWARTRARGAAPPSEPRVSVMKAWKNLDEMAAVAIEQGAHVIFLNFLQPGTDVGYLHILEGVAAHWDAPLITYQGERLDVVHPTREGYRWLAERIAAEIDARGWLQR